MIFLAVAIQLLFSCSSNEEKTKQTFEKLPPNETGIHFSNNLQENDSLNYFTYSYLYMGGGVSAGDINNDGLIDLFFTGNMVPNKLYLNKGNLQFEDITEAANISGDQRWYTGTTMVDINNDGHLDIYCSVGGKFTPKENELYINNGDNTFTESAEAYGIADVGNSVQASFFDYDNDGDLDLYVANYPPTKFSAPNDYYLFKMDTVKDHETDNLYRNDGDSFAKVTNASGVRSFGLTLSATIGDLNQDGWFDIYVSNDFSTPDFLYINNRDGTFTDVLKESTKQTSFYGMGVDIADYNNDGLLDIFQADMDAKNNRRAKANMASMNPAIFWSTVNSGFHYQYMHNTLQLNNGVFKGNIPDFSNTSRLAGVSSTDWSWGPLFADLDNDGFKDLFISNGTRREINNRDYFNALALVTNKRDSLLERSLAIPSEKIDNFVFRNNGDLTFSRINKKWNLVHEGFSNGCVYADLDNDGDLEIVTNNIDDHATLFENKSSSSANHLSLKFEGPKTNPSGIGVKATLFSEGKMQYQELMLTRGFQSSVAPRLHFGLGNAKKVDSIRIQWPDHQKEILRNPKMNSLITVAHKNASKEVASNSKKRGKLFETAKDTSSIVIHKHVENVYNDFTKEILLPHKMSTFGPNIAVGDLNGDGLDDMVVGGASQNRTAVYLQQKAGGFARLDSEILNSDSAYEDMGIHLFDADNDSDLDLYIVSGGNEFEPNSNLLQDRLYINDGTGQFYKSDGIPQMLVSGSKAYSHDFDKDGDLDLFVAGRLVPANYPVPANSYILENRSTNGTVEFVDATSQVAPDLKEIGMVTDGIWSDFDNDGWTDLILVGEWMPITVLKNSDGRFTDVSSKVGVEDSHGWWFSVKDGDFDNDGDMDLIIGNLGLNYKYQANAKETFDVYFYDFDSNNTQDIVLSYFNDGEKFPVRGRECSSQQMPGIKEKFKNYETFSNATLEDIYTEGYLENALHYQVKSFASIYLENNKGVFKIHRLPQMAQLSSINQILIHDYDKDGNLDALIAGNLYASEVETPRNDANIGVLLQGNGKGGFKPILGRESGFYAPGDVKDMDMLEISGKNYVVVAKNSDFLDFIKINQ